MNESIKPLEISFNPEWFQSGYYVYVISIKHISRGMFYYIGQTGDRKHVAARSPFYRLMGHFNTYYLKKGTDAQMVQGLINNKLIEIPTKNKNTRICVEEAIVNKSVSITASYFSISNFNKTDHVLKRKNVEEIELVLINIFISKGFILFNSNKKIGDNKIVSNKQNIAIAEEIFNNIPL